MQNNNPLNKVVFIQKIAAFTKIKSLKDLLRLAYVNNSWNDTIKNYSFHSFEKRICDIKFIDDIDDLKESCDRAIKCGVIWFVEALMSSTKTVSDHMSMPALVCKSASSLDIARLVIKKIEEAGGKDLLCSQLSATGGVSKNCLMYACSDSSSPEVVQFVCEKIVEAGGKDLLQRQLTATTNNGWTCLAFGCRYSSSREVMKFVFEKIVALGGIILLKEQLGVEGVLGCNLLKSACMDSESSEVVKLLATVLVHVDMFKQQYSELAKRYKSELKDKVGIDDASWVPDAESIAEVKKMLTC